jgi:hypothetical protein
VIHLTKTSNSHSLTPPSKSSNEKIFKNMKPTMQDSAPFGTKKSLSAEYKEQFGVKKNRDNPLEAAQRHRGWVHQKARKRQKRLQNERHRKEEEKAASSDDAEFWC